MPESLKCDALLVAVVLFALALLAAFGINFFFTGRLLLGLAIVAGVVIGWLLLKYAAKQCPHTDW